MKSLIYGFNILQVSNRFKSLHSVLVAIVLLDGRMDFTGFWSSSGSKQVFRSPPTIMRGGLLEDKTAIKLD